MLAQPSIRRRIPLFAAALFAALTLACGGSDATGPDGSGAGSPGLKITNSSDRTVILMYYRACGTSSWGSDRLGAHVLGKNETFNDNVSAGCYDVRAWPIEDFEVIWYNQTVPANGKLELTITNASWVPWDPNAATRVDQNAKRIQK